MTNNSNETTCSTNLESAKQHINAMRETLQSMKLILNPPRLFTDLQEEGRLLSEELEDEREENSCLRAALRHARKENKHLEARMAFLYRFLRYHGLERKAKKLEDDETEFFEEVRELRSEFVAERVGLVRGV